MNRKGYLRFFLLAALFSAATFALTMTFLPGPIRSQGRDMSALGLKEFVQTEITYDGVMHEMYWHYEFANQMIRLGRIEDAKAHLHMISFYVNILPMLSREKKFFKDPEAVKKFDIYAQDLISITTEISRNLGKGNLETSGREMEKRIAYLCYHCHKDLKTPIRDITPYGKTIDMGAGHRPR